MKTLLTFLIAIFFVTGCSNGANQMTTTTENKDSTTVRDTTSHPETNTVTPPASNGQY